MDIPDKKITRQEIIQISFLILTLVFICVMIFAIVILYKNIELIKTSPVQYAVDKTPLKSCSCLNSEGKSILFTENKLSFILDPNS